MNAQGRVALPIACALPAGGGEQQMRAWRALDDDHRLDVHRTHDAIVVRYANDDDAITRLTELVRTERSCCAFVRWDVEVSGSDIRLVVSGTPEALSSLDFLSEGRTA
ncbi:MAG TPA: hypothetical protein VN241_11950 [Microbacterium sp.]|nr:hypothetical protein [Microbacterium sp.]